MRSDVAVLGAWCRRWHSTFPPAMRLFFAESGRTCMCGTLRVAPVLWVASLLILLGSSGPCPGDGGLATGSGRRGRGRRWTGQRLYRSLRLQSGRGYPAHQTQQQRCASNGRSATTKRTRPNGNRPSGSAAILEGNVIVCGTLQVRLFEPGECGQHPDEVLSRRQPAVAGGV